MDAAVCEVVGETAWLRNIKQINISVVLFVIVEKSLCWSRFWMQLEVRI